MVPVMIAARDAVLDRSQLYRPIGSYMAQAKLKHKVLELERS